MLAKLYTSACSFSRFCPPLVLTALIRFAFEFPQRPQGMGIFNRFSAVEWSLSFRGLVFRSSCTATPYLHASRWSDFASHSRKRSSTSVSLEPRIRVRRCLLPSSRTRSWTAHTRRSIILLHLRKVLAQPKLVTNSRRPTTPTTNKASCRKCTPHSAGLSPIGCVF